MLNIRRGVRTVRTRDSKGPQLFSERSKEFLTTIHPDLPEGRLPPISYNIALSSSDL